MKKSIIIVLVIILTSCTSTQLVESWKNPDIDTYEPYKILIVGLTSDKESREKFEAQLKTEFELRGVEAVMSISILDDSQQSERMTNDDLNALEKKLIEDGFDTILLTKVIGIEDKIVYKETFKSYDKTHQRFTEDYLMYQDIFYNPEYYEEYTIYHAETSMYCICPTKDRELLWKGYIDITDISSVDKTIKDYVRLAIVVLEEEKLINPIIQELDESTEDTIN